MNKEKEIDLDEISEEGSHILKKDGKFVTSNKELVAKIKLSINNYEIKPFDSLTKNDFRNFESNF